MSCIAVIHSYRPQLCTHTPLSIFIAQVQKWRLPVRAECALSLASTSAGDLPGVACPAQQEQLLCPVPLPCACTADQQLQGCCTCWCRPAVWARCEEFGWLFCKVLDNRLWFYTFPATVSCICCCCKFGPGDSELCGFTQNWTWASAHSLSKKCSAVPLVIVFPLGL